MEIYSVKNDRSTFGQISFQGMTHYQNSLVLEGLCPFCRVPLAFLERLWMDRGKRSPRMGGRCGRCKRGFIAQ